MYIRHRAHGIQPLHGNSFLLSSFPSALSDFQGTKEARDSILHAKNGWGNPHPCTEEALQVFTHIVGVLTHTCFLFHLLPSCSACPNVGRFTVQCQELAHQEKSPSAVLRPKFQGGKEKLQTLVSYACLIRIIAIIYLSD